MEPKKHGGECDCFECITMEDENLVDLYEDIDQKNIHSLNEATPDSARLIVRDKEKMLDRDNYIQSNDDDTELLIYIPFKSSVKMKAITIIGGEDGSSPVFVKVYINHDNPDFSLLEDATPVQELTCIENKDGENSYPVKPNKFMGVYSITLIVTKNYGAKFTRIHYVGFTGTKSKNKRKIMVGIYELKPLPDSQKQKEDHAHQASIYG